MTPAPSANTGPELVGDLNYVSASGIVNEIDPAASWLRNMLVPQSRDRLRSTESVELSIVVDDREMAPFVNVGGEPVSVEGVDYVYRTVTTPNIDIVRPMTASELMFVRRPGAGVYPSRGEQNSAMRSHVARELEKLLRLVENREEWMVAQMLKWTIEYEVQDQAAFTITFPHSAALDVTPSQAADFWDNKDGNGANTANPTALHRQLGREMHREVQMNPSLLILGSEAAEAFEDNTLIKSELDTLNYSVGALNLQNQYSESEARFIGNWKGVQVWEYSRQMVDEAGNPVDLIDPKYAHWVATGPRAEYEMNFGAIPNLKLMLGTASPSLANLGRMGVVPIRRFSDVMLANRGQAVEGRIQTRPLPQLRRPNVIARAKVVSG